MPPMSCLVLSGTISSDVGKVSQHGGLAFQAIARKHRSWVLPSVSFISSKCLVSILALQRSVTFSWLIRTLRHLSAFSLNQFKQSQPCAHFILAVLTTRHAQWILGHIPTASSILLTAMIHANFQSSTPEFKLGIKIKTPENGAKFSN